MNERVTNTIAPLVAASLVGVVSWLSGFSVGLTLGLSLAIAFVTFVPLWLAERAKTSRPAQ